MHALFYILLMVSIFGSSVCKCTLCIHSSKELTSFQDSAGYVTAHHSKCVIFILQFTVYVAYNIYLSSSSPALVIII